MQTQRTLRGMGPHAGRPEAGKKPPHPFLHRGQEIEARSGEVQAVAQVLLDIIRKDGPDSVEYAAAMLEYRMALERLSSLIPGHELWQIERQALPEDLRDQRVTIPGLPESTIPFSILGCWVNERLEEELKREVPKNGRQSSYVKLVSRILDRYVQSFFPAEKIPEFFRASVEKLQAARGQKDRYPALVIRCARPLAETAVLSLITENTNPFKMSSHKSIRKQTGVHLAEKHSSSHKNRAASTPCGYGKRFLGTSVSGRMGLFPDTSEVRPLHGQRLGIPGFDRIVGEQNMRDIPSAEELQQGMPVVLRSGKEARHSHPGLSGMEFSKEQSEIAAMVAIAAQAQLSGADLPSQLSGDGLKLAATVADSDGFADACRSKDRRAQMKIALEALAVEMRALDLIEKFNIDTPYEQALKDVEMARSFVLEYRNPPGAAMVLRSVRRMLELSKQPECYDLSDFELALMAIDERYAKKEPLETMKPPAPSLVPAAPDIPRPSQVPSDLAASIEDEAAAEAGAPEGSEVEAAEVTDEAVAAAEEEPDEGVTEPIVVTPQEAEAAAPEAAPAAAAEEASVQAPEETQAAEEPALTPEGPEETEATIESAPAEAASELSKFSFPFPNQIFDTELEPLLPPKTDKRNGLIRLVARALVSYRTFGYDEENIDPRCVDAVRALRADYSRQAALDYATAIVDGQAIPLPAPTLVDEELHMEVGEPEEEIAQPAARTAAILLSQLDNAEKDLVAGVMNHQECQEVTLSSFLAMEPARRELLMQSYIAARWTEGDFRTDIPRLRRARESLYITCGLPEPTAEQKLSAVSDPATLPSAYKPFIQYLFRTNDVTAKHIEAFRVWISSDPSTAEGHARLADFWNREIVPAEGFNITSGAWLNVPHATRLRLWRGNAQDVLSAGSLAHKLRFKKGEALSAEEAGIVALIYNKSLSDAMRLSEQSLQNLAMSLMTHSYDSYLPSGKKGKVYYPEIVSVAKAAAHQDASSLRGCARSEMEFNTLLDFMGLRIPRANGTLDYSRGSTMAKRSNGTVKPNDDSFSSADISNPDGSAIRLDMVADGMGGHTQGSNGGKTNGQVASGIAKEVFEIAAVAGWIQEPEDVRKLILVADLAIVMEQMRKKAYGLALAEVSQRWKDSGVDIGNMHPEWVGEFNTQVESSLRQHIAAIDAVQENNMGTTMTVAFQKGKKLWFIHCGDSDGKLLRDGSVIFSTVGHSAEYQLRLEFAAKSRENVADSYRQKGIDVEQLDEEGRQRFEREASEAYEVQISALSDFFKNNANVVSSVLGVFPKYVHINNADEGALPIQTRSSDIIEVSSDGKSVPVCDHETPIVIFAECQGDLEEARKRLVDIAGDRRGKGPHQTLCECREREGKVDDITLILRYASEGLAATEAEAHWLSRQIMEKPSILALSQPFQLINMGCTEPAIVDKGRLWGIFDAMINAAEEAPAQTSRDACSLVISSIFNIASARPERAELLQGLAPRIGSWSGLILKKLRESPNASSSKRMMFELARDCVPQDALRSLLSARNEEVARWAAESLGESAAPGSSAYNYPPPSAQPIFNSQTDARGNALDAWSTRYLDAALVDFSGSGMVQDMAMKMNLLPRDLEIMAFYAYSGFKPDVAIDPHASSEGRELTASLGRHLSTADAENILIASYALYSLRETGPDPKNSKKFARGLFAAMKKMDQSAPYFAMFRDLAEPYRGSLL